MATLDELFAREKAWIAACDDVDALLDRIAEWRDDARVGETRGHFLLRMRAGDLVELAQRRVVKLKAAAIQAEERVARPKPARAVAVVPPEPVRPGVRERVAEPVVRRPRDAGEHRQREQAERARDEEAKVAATRLANAQAAKIEADAALARAQAASLMREASRPKVAATAPAAATVPTRSPPRPAPRPAPVATRAPSRARVPPPAKPSAPRATAAAPSAPAKPGVPPISSEDQLALMSVGRWPPSGPPPGHPFWSRDQDWPPEWTLTGMDLARFRGRINVTQKVLAAQLGVATAAIAELEQRPREKVGPAMQLALRRAMDVVGAEERRRREAAAAARATTAGTPIVAVAEVARAPEPAPVAPAPHIEAPTPAVVVPAAAPVRVPLTGADLARLRGERRLSQRQLAVALGVGHGMVAKAEVAASEPLGDRMREAVAAMLAAGGGGATR